MNALLRLATGSATSAILLAATVGAAAPPPGRASFTSQQAWQGRLAYYRSCAECHGGTLEGQFGPALAGGNDNLQYQSVKDVYEYMAAHMPHGDPESLPEQEYLAIMSFIMQMHGIRTGPRALTKTAVEADTRLMNDTR